jgi:hypothetical protein
MLLTLFTTSCLTHLIFLLSAQLTKAYQTAAVLFEVLKAVNVSQKIELDQSVSPTSVLLLWWILACSAFCFFCQTAIVLSQQQQKNTLPLLSIKIGCVHFPIIIVAD